MVKRFGDRTVVDHVSMTVETGEIAGFLGPNGSGKTTTIRMMCGLLTPDAGEGRCWATTSAARRGDQARGRLHDPEILVLRGPDDRGEPDLRRRALRADRARQAVRDTLEDLGLTSRKGQLAGSCRAAGSSGWRWPPASCTSPQLLLLDEPTAGVDPKARREFWDEIHQLAAGGLTVLVSTHYMDEAERCHRINYIAYGKLLAQGTVAEVMRRMPG
jgi:ABC-2 type transport system ATP-binding protein